jgi:hypothetical protein
MNIVRQIQSDHIGIFQRTKLGQSEAKGVAYRLINGFGVRNALFDDVDGLAPECVLHAVGDKTGYILFAEYRFFANRRHNFHYRSRCLIGSSVRHDDFHKRYKMARIPKMGSYKTFAVF